MNCLNMKYCGEVRVVKTGLVKASSLGLGGMNCLQCVQRTRRPCGMSNESWERVRSDYGDLCYHVKVMVPPITHRENLLKDLKPASNMPWLIFKKKKKKHFGEVIEDLCGLEEERPKATRPIRKQLWHSWERNAWTKVVVTTVKKKKMPMRDNVEEEWQRFIRGQEGEMVAAYP